MAAIAQKEKFKRELRAVGVRTFKGLDGKSYIRKEDLDYAMAVGELIEGGFTDKLKAATKSFLKKAVIALLGLGVFAGSASANDINIAQQAGATFDKKMEAIAADEGVNLDVETKFKETSTAIVQTVSLTNLDDGDTIDFKIIKIKDGSFQEVRRADSKGDDNEFDIIFEEFGDLLGDYYKKNMGAL